MKIWDTIAGQRKKKRLHNENTIKNTTNYITVSACVNSWMLCKLRSIKKIKERKRDKNKMKEKNIIKTLNDKLENKMKENPTKTIASLRKQVVIESKKSGIIKNYHFVKNRNVDGLYFGSCVGFDSMYIIEL